VTLEEARALMAKTYGHFNYTPGEGSITLDSSFTAEELEAIAMCLREDDRIEAASWEKP